MRILVTKDNLMHSRRRQIYDHCAVRRCADRMRSFIYIKPPSWVVVIAYSQLEQPRSISENNSLIAGPGLYLNVALSDQHRNWWLAMAWFRRLYSCLATLDQRSVLGNTGIPLITIQKLRHEETSMSV